MTMAASWRQSYPERKRQVPGPLTPNRPQVTDGDSNTKEHSLEKNQYI